ncbi:recombinase family protein [Streptomyces sp. ALI-76-A]|uniref:recombinase family protein n=1 Tax=Streptomyces sp. ALI-76-A TaxID=3025736 RepID=UPI00256F37DB|nr:recombinase family protein [Streptomyces sp. ALI-76-A]MDL5202267.1 recombinase family protein [Streptomyces sp. ALI-76-A]
MHSRGIALRILTVLLAGNYSPKGEGKFFFTMMVAFAELERDMIVERTRAGLDAAKAQGRTGGRPTVITEDVLTVAKARKAKGESVSAIAKALGVSRATLYRRIG